MPTFKPAMQTCTLPQIDTNTAQQTYIQNTKKLSLSNLARGSPVRPRVCGSRFAVWRKSQSRKIWIARYCLLLGLIVTSTIILSRHAYSRLHLPAPYKPGRGDVEFDLRLRSQGPNEISLLSHEAGEFIAEDDLYWSTFEEPPSPVDTVDEGERRERAHEGRRREELEKQEDQARKLLAEGRNRKEALTTLIWWLGEGGVLPAAYQVPAEESLVGLNRRNMGEVLGASQPALEEEDEIVFAEGWEEYAQRQYRIVIFSKVSCLT